MPTKPKIQSFSGSGYDVLNAIRSGASATYQERIPVATQETLAEYGNAVLQYPALQNEFLNALVNRIGRVIITSKSYSNPLRRFKKGMLEFGETVEEIFVNVIQARPFDQEVAETDVFKRAIPNVDAIFHKLDYKNFYKATISNEMLRQAFLSEAGVLDLIGKIVDMMYTSAELDEFIVMKQLIVDYANNGFFYPVNVPAATAENAKEIITTIKQYSNAMEFMAPTYNAMGVMNHTPKSKQVLILDAKFDAINDVNVLASAFNMSKAEFLGQRVLVDNFGTLTNVVAALVDEDWFMVFDNFIGFTENYNGQGLYWNYFYHVWKTFSTSRFSNAILFTTDAVSVTGVTVDPSAPTVTKGTTAKFTATVAGTGYVPQEVTWEVTGTGAVTSTIDKFGVLTVPATEANTSLTVRATSVYDTSKSGTATVTLA